jgi:hypothetical protein
LFALTVYRISCTAACTVGRQLLFKSSLLSETIQIVSVGQVTEALILRRLESVRRPYRLLEDQDLEYVRLLKHPSSLGGVFQASSEERLRTI